MRPINGLRRYGSDLECRFTRPSLPREERIASVDHGSSHAHNLKAPRVRSHTLCGVDAYCIRQDALPGRAWHRLSHRHPLLAIVVNEVGGLSEAGPSRHSGVNRSNLRRCRRGGYASLIPAGLPVWAYSDQIARVDAVRLVLDVDRVLEVMGGEFEVTGLAEPRFTFFDEDLQVLARLLTLSQDDIPSFLLFGDSVVAAIVARISHLCTTNRPKTSRRLGLSKRQLTQVTEFMHDNLSRYIRLSELASLSGLSASQFGRAFKVSTGITPHKWHLAARIEYAKRMLADRETSLVDIALEAGFSEQSHFTRAFTSANGISPNAWRRSRFA
jgi:AraC family transcriptional regulator